MMTKKQLREGKSVFHLQLWIIVHSGGTLGQEFNQEMKQEPQGNAAHWLVLSWLSYPGKTHLP